MKRDFWIKRLPIFLVTAALVVTAVAWQVQPGKNTRPITDTVPDKNKVRNIDDALEQLEKGQKELERTLQEKNWDNEMKDALDKAHFDAQKMKQQIDEAVKQIDAKKIQDEVAKAMREVDLQKMKTDLQENLDKVDMKDMKLQLEQAIKQIDVAKLQADINASIAKVDVEKIKAELDKVKQVDMKVIEENLQKMKPQIEKSMQDARQSMEKAKKELIEYKAFIDGLDKDGLIDKNKNYTIQYKNGDLDVNGKKQPAEVVKKYNSYLKGKKDFTLSKGDDKFDINND